MKHTSKYFLRNIMIVLIGLFFIIVLYITHLMANLVVPIIVAFFTAMFLHPFIIRLKNIKIPNLISIFFVYVIFIITMSIILIILGISFTKFLRDLPDLTKNFSKDILNYLNNLYDIKFFKDNISIDELRKILKDTISFDNLNIFIIKPIFKTLNIIESIILFSFALIFIMPWFESIYDKVLIAFPGKKGRKINEIILTVVDQIQRYMSAKFIVSLLAGFTGFIICLIFNVKYPVLWRAVIFVMNFIPFIGPAIGVSLPVLLYLLQFQSFLNSSLLLLALVIDHVIIAYAVEPLVMSKGVNLNPLFILISLLIWGFVWGIAGVILSIPIMSALNLIFENIGPLKFVSILISTKEKKLPKMNKDVKSNKNFA